MRSFASISLLLYLGAMGAAAALAQAPHRVGGEFQVNSHTTDQQTMPAVAVASGGDFAVVWEGRVQDGDSYGVLLQLFDANGARLGAELQVNLYTVGAQRAPAVAASAAGHFVVVWRGDGQDTDDSSGIFAQRFDGAGTRLASEFEVNSHTVSFQVSPTVAMADGGDFVVVWASTAGDPGYGIRAQRFATPAPFWASSSWSTATPSRPRRSPPSRWT